jgi:hypothetical protein
MNRHLIRILALIATLSLLGLSATPLRAQSTAPPPCTGKCGSGSSGSSDSGFGLSFEGLSTAATNAILHDLAAADQSCDDMRLIPPPKAVDESLYRLDCYRILYKRLADSLPDTGDYAPVKRALLKASRDLDRIVTANLDRTAPTISIRERAKPNAPAISGIRAIKKSGKKRAYQQAEKVVREASIVILRAGEIPTRRTAHYTQIAQAVRKNLVVLRSA